MLLLGVLIAAPVRAETLYEQVGATEFDVEAVNAHLEGWRGAGRACFDAATDGAALAACAPEAEATEPVGHALIAYHVALHAVLADDHPAFVAWMEVAVASLEGELAADDPLWVVLLGTLGTALIMVERYEEARIRWAQVLEVGRPLLLQHPEDLAMSLLQLAWLQLVTGQQAEGLASCAEAAADPEAEHLKNMAGLTCLWSLGSAAVPGGDWATVRRWWAPWLSIAAAGVLPPGDPRLLSMKGQLGRAHVEMSEFETALVLLQEADAAQRKAPTADDPQGLMYSFWVGRCLAGLGRLEEAEILLSAYVAYIESMKGTMAGELVDLLNHHADALQRLGRYDEAEHAFQRAIAIATPHDWQADALNRYAELLRETGRLNEALETLRLMESLQARLFGPESPEAATAIFNQANSLRGLGRFAEAKVGYERTLAIYLAAYGPDHPFVASVLTSLGGLLHELGDFDQAIPLYERAVVVYETAWGPNSRYLGTALNNLAQVRWATGQLQEAHDLFWRSFEVLGTALGLDHPEVTSVRANYAVLLRSAGHYVEARDLLKDCVETSSNRLGPNSFETAKYISRYADTLYYTNEWPASARWYERAIAITEATLGPDHPDLVEYHQELANTWALLGNRKKARAEMALALQLVDRNVRPLLDVTSERERMALIRSLRDNLDKHLSLLDEPEDVAGNYAAMIGWKGAVRNSLAKQRAALLADDDPALLVQVQALDAVRRELAALVFGDSAIKTGQVAALTAEKERLEKELARGSKAFRAHQEEARITPKQLCGRLARDEVLVDLLRYDRTLLDSRGRPEADVESYLAMVSLGGSCATPLRVELGDAASIDLAVARYRRRVASGAAAAGLESRAKELGGRLWRPIAQVIGARERVWLVPDGALSSLPFGALMHDDGRYLLETHRVGTLANALDLVQSGPPGRGALVAGGIVYDAPGTPIDAGHALATRSAPRGGLEDFSYLAATADEAQAVAEHLRGREDVSLLSASEVTEARLRRDAPGKRLLHLATHGFFATGAVRSGLGEAGGMNPMLLSGVVLAGANVGGSGDGDDGILTAEEVVGLDLRGVELVVLSACETGLGEVRDGEGVLGLRRAFALAGARSLVLSLWKVPDQETRELMDRFYAALATESPADALRAAQLALLGSLRARGKEGHPFYWAAFVVSGR